MSDEENDKKKLVLKIVGGILGVIVCVYLFLVIYTNYISRPVVLDGKSAGANFGKLHKQEIENAKKK